MWPVLTVAAVFLCGLAYFDMEGGSPAPHPASETPIQDQYEIRAEDSGKTFSYPLTSRFTVLLDAATNPKAELSCDPVGILGPISNIPSVAPPLYAARFETVTTGTCVLRDRDFSVTIVSTAGN